MNSNNHKHILIVDDESSIRALLKHALEDFHNYQVILAADGHTALDFLKLQHFDLVLTDWCMNGMNGLELAKLVRILSPDTQILLMTGSDVTDFDDQARALLAGLIKKPFTLSLVIKTIGQVINHQA